MQVQYNVKVSFDVTISFVDLHLGQTVTLPDVDFVRFIAVGMQGDEVEYSEDAGSTWVPLKMGQESPELAAETLVRLQDVEPVRIRIQSFVQSASLLTSSGQVITLPTGGGGGASAFTDLTDAPSTITAKALVGGNVAGDALEMNSTLSFNNDLRLLQIKTDDGSGGGLRIQSDSTNSQIMTFVDNTQVSILIESAENAAILVDSNGLSINGFGLLRLLNIPTSNPSVVGRIYRDGGVLMISTG